MSHLTTCSIDDLLSRMFDDLGLNGEKFGLDARTFDIEKAAVLIDSFRSANYCRERMPFAHPCESKEDLLAHGMAQCGHKEGQVLEFGVFTGGTLTQIANFFADTTVYGFDTFEGLPVDWHSRIKKGSFNLEGQAPTGMPANVRFVKGLFEESLPEFLREHDRCIRFLHVDSDLYSSADTVLRHLEHLIVPGTVIVFDEYFNYLGWERGEYLAFSECVHRCGVRYRYVGYARRSQSVAVVITEKGAAPGID